MTAFLAGHATLKQQHNLASLQELGAFLLSDDIAASQTSAGRRFERALG